MTNLADIDPDHLEIVRKILHKHLPPDTQIWVFGSRAKQTTRRASDLDLAIEWIKPIAHNTLLDLDIDFDDSDLPYTVDVIDLRTVSNKFKEIVDAQKVVFPSDECRTR